MQQINDVSLFAVFSRYLRHTQRPTVVNGGKGVHVASIIIRYDEMMTIIFSHFLYLQKISRL